MSYHDELVCSRKACRRAATRAVLWRNPKIHDVTRRKVWLACAEHESVLHDHLAVRGFPVQTCALDEIPADAG